MPDEAALPDEATMARLRAVLADEGTRTMEEIAEEHGVSLEAMIVTRRGLGLSAELGRPIYGAALEDHARRLATAVDSGIPLQALLDLNRVIARATTAVVAAAGEAVLTLLEGDPPDASVRGLHTAELVETFTPVLERVLIYALREHVRELVRQEAGAIATWDRRGNVRDVAVGFADLVGFTRLGDTVPPEELSDVAGRLERLAQDNLRQGATLIKTIGDAVMIVADDGDGLVGSLLDLAAAVDREPDFPQIRAGAAWGPAMHRWGDWYGRVVNLASRLAAVADPGQVAADSGLASLVPRVSWAPAGEHPIRGIESPVTVLLARPD